MAEKTSNDVTTSTPESRSRLQSESGSGRTEWGEDPGRTGATVRCSPQLECPAKSVPVCLISIVTDLAGHSRKTMTVDQHHPLRSLTALGFTDCFAPLLGRGEAAIEERLVPFQQALAVQCTQQRAPRIQPSPSSCHCFSRRQQVASEGDSSDRNRHAAPVCRIHRIPSKQARFDAHGPLGCPFWGAVRARTPQSAPTAHPSPASVTSS